jgi:Tol biopolymer transport system component
MSIRIRSRVLRVGALAAAFVPSTLAQNAITRIAVNHHGVEGDMQSPDGVLSDDARFVAFSSVASNLVAGDTNGSARLGGADVFVRDFSTGAIVRVSLGAAGVEADGPSWQASISADGRFVAFTSWATNLVSGDTNGVSDVFVHDRDPDGNGVFDEGNGATIRVSVASDGTEGDGDSDDPVISADGHLVLFTTLADDLVAGDTNQAYDVCSHDLATGATARVSLGAGGIEPDDECRYPVLSPDATLAAFTSQATNLVANDTNQTWDVFVRDLATDAIERVSVDSTGIEGDRDSTYCGGLTADDRYVVFRSAATNLVAGDRNGAVDVFLHDRATGATTRVSLGQGGVEGDNSSFFGRARAISADGSLIAFSSWADNLVPGDTNVAMDVFVRDLVTGDVSFVSARRSGGFPNSFSTLAGATPDFSRVLFLSWATDVVSYDHNGSGIFAGFEVFLRDMRVAAGTASVEAYADGLAGAFGVPALAPAATPVLGTSLHVDLGNSSGAATLGFLVVGFDPAELPICGGTLVADPFHWIVPVALPAGGGGIDGTIPSDSFVRGFSVFTQLVEVDPGAADGLSMSRGVEFVYGD